MHITDLSIVHIESNWISEKWDEVRRLEKMANCKNWHNKKINKKSQKHSVKAIKNLRFLWRPCPYVIWTVIDSGVQDDSKSSSVFAARPEKAFHLSYVCKIDQLEEKFFKKPEIKAAFYLINELILKKPARF